MSLVEAKKAIAALQSQKNEIDALLAGICGGSVPAPAPDPAVLANDPYLALVGKGIYVRQATFHLMGRLESVGPNELVLSEASTVFNSGALEAFLKSGKAAESERMGRVVVHRNAIVDCCECKV